MATTFERVCKSVWEEMSDGPLKTKAVTFLAKYEHIVSLFCDRVDLLAVVENMADLGKVPDEAMRVIASGPLCVSLFRGPYEKAARKLLQADMHKQIRELFHNNFESSDVDVVKNRMEENLKCFEARTNVGKTKTVFKVTFLGVPMKFEAKHAEQEFKKLLSAELKSVGIANGQLARTVWEQMVLGQRAHSHGVEPCDGSREIPDECRRGPLCCARFLRHWLLHDGAVQEGPPQPREALAHARPRL